MHLHISCFDLEEENVGFRQGRVFCVKGMLGSFEQSLLKDDCFSLCTSLLIVITGFGSLKDKRQKRRKAREHSSCAFLCWGPLRLSSNCVFYGCIE